MVWTPVVRLAAKGNDHCVVPAAAVLVAVWAPVISRHLVSVSVVTLSVSAAPGSANRVPLTTRVPAPPVNDAPVALAAWATEAPRTATVGHGSTAAIPASASPRRTGRPHLQLPSRDERLRCEATALPSMGSSEIRRERRAGPTRLALRGRPLEAQQGTGDSGRPATLRSGQ